jgi:ribosomal protein L24E
MLKIASYSLQGQIVRVKLKCTCSDGKIFEVQEEGTTLYFCSKCRSRKTLEQLKKEASTYWRNRSWAVDCEPDQRAQPRVHIEVPVELTVKASRYSPPYCVLHGQGVVVSETGMLVVVHDFQQSYFQDITSAYRYVEIATAKPVEGFPTSLTGRVCGVSYRPTELPRCRVGMAFEGVTTEVIEALRRYMQEHGLRTPSSLGDTAPAGGQP